MPKRYGIYTNKAFGVSISSIQKVAREFGHNHELALALWESGWVGKSALRELTSASVTRRLAERAH